MWILSRRCQIKSMCIEAGLKNVYCIQVSIQVKAQSEIPFYSLV